MFWITMSPAESRSKLLDTHQNRRRLSMEIESDSIHHARCNTVACMCCTNTHTHTHTHTHARAHTQTHSHSHRHLHTGFIHVQVYKTHWVLRSERDNIHRYKVKCINQKSPVCFYHLQWNKQEFFIHINRYTCFHIQFFTNSLPPPSRFLSATGNSKSHSDNSPCQMLVWFLLAVTWWVGWQ